MTDARAPIGRRGATPAPLAPLGRPDQTDARRIELGPDTTITALDADLAADLGYRVEDLIGRRLSLLLPPEHLQRVGAVLISLVEGKVASATAPEQLLHESGEWLPVALSARARTDPERGRPVGFEILVGPLTRPPDDLIEPNSLPVPFLQGTLAAAVLSAGGELQGVNQAWTELFGPGQSRGQRLPERVLDGVGRELGADLAAMAERRRSTLRHEVRIEGSAGIFWCRLSASRLDTGFGTATRLLVTAEDVTRERVGRRVLAANEGLFRSVAETSPVGMARLTNDLALAYANPAWLALTGSGDVPLGSPLADLVHPDDAPLVAPEAIMAKRGEPIRVRARHGASVNGSAQPALEGAASIEGSPTEDLRWVTLRVARVVGSNEAGSSETAGWVATAEDVTDLVQRHDAVARLAEIVERTTDMVGIADLSAGELVYLNAAASDLFAGRGVPASRLSIGRVCPEAERARFRSEILPTLTQGRVWSGEIQLVAADGSVRLVLVNLAPDLDSGGNVVTVSALGRDITDQRRTAEELAFQATHDALTGLPNRSLLLDHLTLALARARRERAPVAVLFCDLDRFKAVNDGFGHDAGDELLRDVAARISRILRPSDTVARLGGDEFVVVCEQISGELEALAIAGRIASAVDKEPYAVGGTTIAVTASIGVALSENGGDGATLLREADTAMYRAKREGRARAELFNETLRARNDERQELSRQLAEAIAEQQLTLHYQPIVELATDAVLGVEVLARWPHPTRGMLRPADFLPLASDTGQSALLDEVVLRAACTQAGQWELELGAASPIMHVNLSSASLGRRDLLTVLTELLDESGVPARKLCLELPADTQTRDDEEVAAQLERLHELGVRIALDDFGQRPTQLGRLRDLPLDELKLDPSLSAPIGDDPAAARVIAGIVAFAHALDLVVVAEGVESDFVRARLAELGCDAAQGDAFFAPTPLADTTSWLPAP